MISRKDFRPLCPQACSPDVVSFRNLEVNLHQIKISIFPSFFRFFFACGYANLEHGSWIDGRESTDELSVSCGSDAAYWFFFVLYSLRDRSRTVVSSFVFLYFPRVHYGNIHAEERWCLISCFITFFSQSLFFNQCFWCFVSWSRHTNHLERGVPIGMDCRRKDGRFLVPQVAWQF